MRMRRKEWAHRELAVCPYYIKEPTQYRGRWAEQFVRRQPLHLELGCGKGGFISQLASANAQTNYLAIDIKTEVMGEARRKCQAAYEAVGRPIDNLKIMPQEIQVIEKLLAPEDTVERIYINFPNPWPRGKHKKRRLTHTRQLVKYRQFLAPGAEIRFKTDDDELFEESQLYFKTAGFVITYLTRDLHHSDYTENIVTEHEQMFAQQGIPIKFCIAKTPLW
ncbi:tRNA (guanosine(46)-N7)-methyltransferase TrmB [Neobittarella massiliensis]|uniref:tRNA (guanosine(46)-N7)-methyltransferase TrmB n=1 Tax=Neobittarella massiliensis (ex Bilen et al. 2018) TaxID=2041842 RepID=UPI000CF74412|nr:tRNA (guanosine(46)-N7)-methyltransferase TrmB [Neobittarella massiliensis]